MITINEKKVMVHVINTVPEMMALCVEALKKTVKPEGWEFQAEVGPLDMDGTTFYRVIKSSDAYYHLFIETDCLIVDEQFWIRFLACFEDTSVGLVSIAGTGIDKSTVGCYAKEDESGNVSVVGVRGRGGDIAIPTALCWCIKGDILPPRVGAEAVPGAVAMEYWLKGMRCVVPDQDMPLCLFAKDESDRRKCASELLEPIYGTAMRSMAMPNLQVGRRVNVHNRVSFTKGSGDDFALLKLDDDASIGDNVTFDLHHPIFVGKTVRIDRDATIGKVTGHERGPEVTTIADRAIIEADVAICCGVTIGRGAQVLAGSVVESDIPPYVIAVGAPAKIIAVYDYDNCKYWPVNAEFTAEELLIKRGPSRPLVTIGVPTYNRSRFLRKCLEAIFYDIGDDPQFEVLISDNCSDDDTQKLVEEFAARYSNLNYVRNKENIGSAANFDQVYNMARGKFVFSLGDDDYYNPGVLYHMLEAVKQNPDCSIIAMRPVSRNGAIVRGEGAISYLNYYTYSCTWISLHGFRTDIVHKVKIDEKYKDGFFLQVVKQFAMLMIEPKYAILEIEPFRNDIGGALDIMPEEHKKLDKAKKLLDFTYVFFHEYYGTLEECKCYGLTDEAISYEKKRHLFELVINWIAAIGERHVAWSRRDTMKYYDEQYCKEPYYLEWREKLQRIVENDRV